MTNSQRKNRKMKYFLFITIFCIFSADGFSQLTNNGATIIIESGAKLILNGNDLNTNDGSLTNTGILEIQRDLKNTGTITSSAINSKIVFTGSSSSLFTIGNTTLRTLDVRKSNADVELSGDLAVQKELSFNSSGNSRLVLSDSDLILEPSATITGASSQAFIQTNGNGMLIKEMSGPGAFTFPVGNGQNLTALETNVTGTNFSGAKLKVRVVGSKEPNVPGTVLDYLERHWVVEAENIGGYDNALSGNYLPSDVVGQELLIEGASFDGTMWSYINAGRGTNTVSANLTTNSSTFTGREQGAPLPVELVDFVALKTSSNDVQLSWTTASEFNTSYYSIERSTDATHWQTIGEVSAKGQGEESLTYDFIDAEIPQDVRSQSVLYYRLHIIDFDGYSEYSPVDVVNFGEASKSLGVYPNPTSDVVNLITTDGQNEVLVFNALGKLVHSVVNTTQLNLASFPVGIYQVSVRSGGVVQLATVIKSE